MKPILVLTMGDPGGVGPEIVVKALASPRVWRVARPLVAGSRRILEEAARRFAPAVRFTPVPARTASASGRTGHPSRRAAGGQRTTGAAAPAVLMVSATPADSQAPVTGWSVPLIEPARMPALAWRPGRVSASTGRAAYLSLEAAVACVIAGGAHGVVTAPLHKGALDAAGIEGPGHTEIVARMAGVREVALMLCHGRVRVAHATLHESLARALRLLTPQRLHTTIRLVHEALRAAGVLHPRIGVFALNPHAGEGGIMGREESRIVTPAIARARRHGIDAAGPFPPDTLFVRHVAGEFDALVALYHDQGHIPFKLFAFKAPRPTTPSRCPGEPAGLSVRGVNATIGLPFVRTSVDHGVALDIAGRGLADPESLIDAIRLAASLVRGRHV